MRALDSLFAAGDTALFAAVAQASELVATAPEPRKAVVLLSDGENFGVGAATTRAQALAAAQSSGVPFFVVALGAQLDTQFLQELSSTTNGQLFASPTAAQLGSLYATIADRLREQYTVRVDVPAGVASGTHCVAFSVGSARGEASFNFTAPTVVPPPAQIPRLSRITGVLTDPTTLRLEPTARGKITFLLDGDELDSATDGSGRIDPLHLNPASAHTLEVPLEHLGALRRDAFDFRVAALAPRLVFAGDQKVAVGETIRPNLVAQPGSATVSYFIDDRVEDIDEGPPWEFTLPLAGELGAGAHSLRVVAESVGGKSEESFAFTVVIPARSRAGAYLVLAYNAPSPPARCSGYPRDGGHIQPHSTKQYRRNLIMRNLIEVALWARGVPGHGTAGIEGRQAELRLMCAVDVVAREGGAASPFAAACAKALDQSYRTGGRAATFTVLGEAYQLVAAEIAKGDPTVDAEPATFVDPKAL